MGEYPSTIHTGKYGYAKPQVGGIDSVRFVISWYHFIERLAHTHTRRIPHDYTCKLDSSYIRWYLPTANHHLASHSHKGVYMKVDYLRARAIMPTLSKESMMTVSIKGITKVAIENPVSQLRQAFTSIPDAFNRKVNDQTNRKVITNIPTQLLGNRVMSCEVTYTQGENKITVDLVDFMPAREVSSGKLSKALAGNVYSDYRTGNLPDAKIGLREYWSVLSYFTGCMLTGMLPTPVKPSGQSTIMSEFIKTWLTDNGLQVDSVAITGKNDSRMVYSATDFTNVYNAFQSNAVRILETWSDRQGKGGSKSGQIDWV